VRYLRKKEVARRYSTTPRTIERMAKDGRLPAPQYLISARIPLWCEETLDERDRAATRAGRAAEARA
jgi:hypothetical protein